MTRRPFLTSSLGFFGLALSPTKEPSEPEADDGYWDGWDRGLSPSTPHRPGAYADGLPRQIHPAVWANRHFTHELDSRVMLFVGIAEQETNERQQQQINPRP